MTMWVRSNRTAAHPSPLAPRGLFSLPDNQAHGMEAMSDAVGPGDLVLCVNAAPNHVTGWPVPLQAGETYVVFAVMEFACPCGRSDALLDVGVDFAWCQSRFRLLPKPKAEKKPRAASKPKETENV